MAKNPTTPSEEEEWEEVQSGLGEQWDFEAGPMIGYMIGKFPIELPEKSWTKNDDGSIRKVADAWKFALRDTGEEVFIWDSFQLSEALTNPGSGDLVRISFDGYREFDNGRRRVKKYKVALKK
jgi:hypothetical protein